MTKVVGVDFSGAGTDDHVGKTWVTEGQLDGKVLTIDCCHQVSRKGLTELLRELPNGTVAAMDFPFGIPMKFSSWWLKSETFKMSDLWKAAAKSELSEFCKELYAFQPTGSIQLLRVGDLHCPLAQPCLHPKGRSLVPMTFHGMQMLHKLHKTGRFHIPPIPAPRKSSPVLLEVMPGQALANYRLQSTRYKDGANKVDQEKRRQNRRKILKQLPRAAELELHLHEYISHACVEDKGGDALDSLVAATVAARWTRSKDDFIVPTTEIVKNLKRKLQHKRQASPQAKGMTELAAAKREGWIYVPKA